MSTVEFQSYSCYYKNKKSYFTALDNISFRVESGQFFVIFGPSGSGKTTLLKSILGLCEYGDGEILIDGLSIDTLPLFKSNIGFVRQETDLYPHLTVYENIAFPLRNIHTPQQEVDRRVKQIAKALDIHFLLTRKPKQLSGGQHQRVAIARALIKNPSLLLFDEPFSNIDPALRTELRQLAKTIHETYNCTVLFVTHDITEACSLAQRILVLNDGKIDFLGTPEEYLHETTTV